MKQATSRMEIILILNPQSFVAKLDDVPSVR